MKRLFSGGLLATILVSGTVGAQESVDTLLRQGGFHSGVNPAAGAALSD